MRRLLCHFFGHRRHMDYDPRDDYALVIYCERCREVLER